MIAADKNVINFKCVIPAQILTTLKGMGISPLKLIIQNPHFCISVWNFKKSRLQVVPHQKFFTD